MSYQSLDPKRLTGTPRMSSRRDQDVNSGNASGRGFTTNENDSNTESAQKKACLADELSAFFKDTKGLITGIVQETVDNVKSAVTGAINDVKEFGNALKDAVSCIDLEFKLGKIDVKGIFDDIKSGVEDGINDAINYAKGIVNDAKDFKAYLTCEKGTAYEREESSIDSQLRVASDEDDAAGIASIKSNFTSGAAGTSEPMSPRRRRDIANGNASGRNYVNTQVANKEQSTLNSIKSNARAQCVKNNSGKSLTGMVDSLNISNYG